MNHLSDSQLLCGYLERRSEEAFVELVRRYVDFVYSAALRMVRDTHLAEDVTQAAFVALAQNAPQLTDRPVLSGWLHRTAQNLAAKTVRSDVRRRAREQEAAAMNDLLATESAADWQRVAPHLDTALGELSEADRDALLLRYFEGKSAREMARILGTSEEAAQKRVHRAVDRLREVFAKRGVAVGASGLVVVISANAVQAAPVGLALTISTAAVLAGTTIATTATATATKAIVMTTLQKTLVTATIAAAVGTGIYEARQATNLREQNISFKQQQASFAERIQQMERERDDATNRLASLTDEVAKMKSNNAELLRLRGEVARLRQDARPANDPILVAAQSWLSRVTQLKKRLEQMPEERIPELKLLEEKDWLAAVQDSRLNSDNEDRQALGTLRTAGKKKFVPVAFSALQKFLQANGKQFPTDLGQLQRYFVTPVENAILQRWAIVPAKTLPAGLSGFAGEGEWAIAEKAPVDGMFDSRFAIGAVGYGKTDYLLSENIDLLIPVYRAYEKANNGEQGYSMATDYPSRLVPYATTPEQQAVVQKLIERSAVRK